MKRLNHRRLREPTPLPNVSDRPRDAFFHGWWAGIFVGVVIGAAIGVLLAKGVR